MGKGTINDSGTELTFKSQNNRDSAPFMSDCNASVLVIDD